MADKIKLRRGLQADLPTLDQGEPGFTTDTERLFIGNPPGGNVLVAAGGIVSADPGATDGYVAFFTSDSTLGSDQDFFWDDVNKRLGLGTLTPTHKLSVDGYIVPVQDNVSFLGTPDLRWRDGYFGPSSINVTAKASLGEAPSDVTFSFRIDPNTGALDILDDGISALSVSSDAVTFPVPPVLTSLNLPQVDDATAPTFSFGDGDSGFYESLDDTLNMALAGGAAWIWNTTFYAADGLAGGPVMVRAAATATVPTLLPAATDFATGIGANAIGHLSLIAGNVEGLRITGGLGQPTIDAYGDLQVQGGSRLVLPTNGDEFATRATLAFGDGDSGFLETIDDTIVVTIADAQVIRFDSSGLAVGGPTGGIFRNVAATATVPNFAPTTVDPDTGMGSAAADQLSLITGGFEGLRITGTGGGGSATIDAYGNLQVQIGNHILVPEGTALVPSILIGIGDDDGLFSPVEDEISVSLQGVERWTFTPTSFQTQGTNEPALLAETASATNPTLVPSNNDQNTGIGWTQADALSMVAGGFQVAQFREAAGLVQFTVPIQNDATAPSIAFGDLDTGIYESTDDVLRMAIAGVSTWRFNSTSIGSLLTNSFQLLNETPTSTNPGVGPLADSNTGIGWAAEDQLSLIAGGVEGLRVTETGGGIEIDAYGDLTLQGVSRLLLPSVNNAAIPTLAFGDGDTGLYEIIDDSLSISVAGTSRWEFSANDFRSSNTAGPSIQNETASATNPVFAFRFDLDTGIGHVAADQLSLIAGGVEMLRLVETGVATGDQLIIGPAGIIGSAATPSLAFGDGNTGFYESSDNLLRVSVSGTDQFIFVSGAFLGNVAGSPQMQNLDSTSTVPVFVDATDTDTGIGFATGDQLSLIAGGVEMLRLVETGTSTTDQLIIAPAGIIGAAATPALAFGDGDTGIFEQGDDILSFATAGINRFEITASLFSGGTSTSGGIRNVGSSATVASIVPGANDADTGLGHPAFPAANAFTLIAGGIEAMRITGDGPGQPTIDAYGDIQIQGGSRLLLPQRDFATAPTISFGDGDSGFYESADDQIRIALGGGPRWRILTNLLRGDGGLSGALVNESSSSTNPTLAPNVSDLDTGIGSGTADQLSLIAGGVEMLRLTETGVSTTDQLIIGPAGIIGAAATPALAFGDGDTGFFEVIDDVMSLSTGGAERWQWSGSIFQGVIANAGLLRNIASSATVPTLNPSNQDLDTGIGHSAADQLSLVAGGVEMLRLVETGTSTTDQLIIGPAGIIGAQATPSLAFGDGDSGFFEVGDDSIGVSNSGSQRFQFSANNQFTGASGTAFACIGLTAGPTAVAFAPNKTDTNTGIAWAEADALSLAAGGTELLRLSQDPGALGEDIIDAYGNLQVHGQSFPVLPATLLPSGTTQIIDWNDGNFQILDLESATGDVTVTLINGKPGASYALEVRQDSATPRDIIWPDSVTWSGGGVTPVISAGADAVDVVSFIYNGATYRTNIGQDFS